MWQHQFAVLSDPSFRHHRHFARCKMPPPARLAVRQCTPKMRPIQFAIVVFFPGSQRSRLFAVDAITNYVKYKNIENPKRDYSGNLGAVGAGCVDV